MRGKQAFGENLKMVLKESMDKAVSLVAYRRFMQELFRKYDENHSGLMELTEVKHALETLGVRVAEDSLQALVAEYDLDKDGALDIDEFTQLITQAALDEGSELPEATQSILRQVMSQPHHDEET